MSKMGKEIFYNCDNYWDNTPLRRREMRLIYSAFAIIVAQAAWVCWTKEEAVEPGPFVIGIALTGIAYIVFAWRRFSYMEELERRWRDVPHRIQMAAVVSFESQFREAAIECHEGHFPGDCPLCGAQ